MHCPQSTCLPIVQPFSGWAKWFNSLVFLQGIVRPAPILRARLASRRQGAEAPTSPRDLAVRLAGRPFRLTLRGRSASAIAEQATN